MTGLDRTAPIAYGTKLNCSESAPKSPARIRHEGKDGPHTDLLKNPDRDVFVRQK